MLRATTPLFSFLLQMMNKQEQQNPRTSKNAIVCILDCGLSIRVRLTESETHPVSAPAPVPRREGVGSKNEESTQQRNHIFRAQLTNSAISGEDTGTKQAPSSLAFSFK